MVRIIQNRVLAAQSVLSILLPQLERLTAFVPALPKELTDALLSPAVGHGIASSGNWHTNQSVV